MEAFIGDSDVTYASENTFSFKCFYKKTEQEKEKTKEGVVHRTDYLVYISPLEIFEKTGSYELPKEFLMNLSAVKASFMNSEQEVLNIKSMEPLKEGSINLNVAYELSLKTINSNYIVVND